MLCACGVKKLGNNLGGGKNLFFPSSKIVNNVESYIPIKRVKKEGPLPVPIAGDIF